MSCTSLYCVTWFAGITIHVATIVLNLWIKRMLVNYIYIISCLLKTRCLCNNKVFNVPLFVALFISVSICCADTAKGLSQRKLENNKRLDDSQAALSSERLTGVLLHVFGNHKETPSFSFRVQTLFNWYLVNQNQSTHLALDPVNMDVIEF